MYKNLVVVRQDISETLYITQSLLQVFGWDLKTSSFTAHQKRCHALLQAGKLQDAVRSFRYNMVNFGKTMKAS
jgi:hypothetical protein